MQLNPSTAAESHFGDTLSPFHLALRVHDLDAAKDFYSGLLGAEVGRESERWIDFDLGGHQITVHLDESLGLPTEADNPVDGDRVPIPHFGIVLDIETWRAFGDRLKAAGTSFVIEPRIRFEGEVGEQGTLFLRDPSGNALEFKGFKTRSTLFSR